MIEIFEASSWIKGDINRILHFICKFHRDQAVTNEKCHFWKTPLAYFLLPTFLIVREYVFRSFQCNFKLIFGSKNSNANNDITLAPFFAFRNTASLQACPQRIYILSSPYIIQFQTFHSTLQINLYIVL